ncbi:MAG: hypothetical protein ACXW61_08730 [Gemmatirosa sp.]
MEGAQRDQQSAPSADASRSGPARTALASAVARAPRPEQHDAAPCIRPRELGRDRRGRCMHLDAVQLLLPDLRVEGRHGAHAVDVDQRAARGARERTGERPPEGDLRRVERLRRRDDAHASHEGDQLRRRERASPLDGPRA